MSCYVEHYFISLNVKNKTNKQLYKSRNKNASFIAYYFKQNFRKINITVVFQCLESMFSTISNYQLAYVYHGPKQKPVGRNVKL